jgi:hypothetical protein
MHLIQDRDQRTLPHVVSYYMEVSGQLYAPAALTSVPTRGWIVPKAGLDVVAKKISLSHEENLTPVVQPITIILILLSHKLLV